MVWCCGVRAAAPIVPICTGIVAVIIAGPWSLAYLALYMLATVPGWPLGRALFGRAHPAGWVSGALIGYGLTCLAFWVVLALGFASSLAPSWSPGRSMTASRGAGATSRSHCVVLPAWDQTEARA